MDFADAGELTQYQSNLKHSAWAVSSDMSAGLVNDLVSEIRVCNCLGLAPVTGKCLPPADAPHILDVLYLLARYINTIFF